jgi:hypothetical protein
MVHPRDRRRGGFIVIGGDLTMVRKWPTTAAGHDGA